MLHKPPVKWLTFKAYMTSVPSITFIFRTGILKNVKIALLDSQPQRFIIQVMTSLKKRKSRLQNEVLNVSYVAGRVVPGMRSGMRRKGLKTTKLKSYEHETDEARSHTTTTSLMTAACLGAVRCGRTSLGKIDQVRRSASYLTPSTLASSFLVMLW